jgi:23S rRNA pseudouridine2605 synthase
VTINGETVQELGTRIDPMVDEVRFDGDRVVQEKKVYLLFNKPKGVVCTNARNEQRKRVIDFLDKVKGRIYTIGRLDAESEGLILLTNDGDFAQAMAHPKFGVPKTYAVLVRGNVDADAMHKVRGGVWLSDGRTSGASVKVERRGRDRTYLKVTIREGKNREVRRVFAKLGNPVLSLKRVRIGTLNLHGLRSGAHRFLRPEEVDSLYKAAREES